MNQDRVPINEVGTRDEDESAAPQAAHRQGLGIVGGGVGAQIIGALVGGGAEAAAGPGGLDIGSIIGQIASGGVGGGILTVVVGLIKQAMGSQKAV